MVCLHSMKMLLVAGARPNFMKIAPIIDAFRPHHDLAQVLLVHTGQHYGGRMSDDFFRELGIPEPDFNLGVGSGTHAEQTAKVMVAFEKICLEHRPDWALVVGDVNSTVACAITAKKLGIRVAHVEAGLRSRDMSMPEEINRLCTDAISDLLFTTDEEAGSNLRGEGVPEDRVHFVGNTMIDTLLRNIDSARQAAPLNGHRPGSFGVLTLHRPGNVDNQAVLAGILRAVGHLTERLPILFPIHPRTVKNLEAFGLLDSVRSNQNLHLMEPLSYLPFIGLVAEARLVLTDSGGIQEETTVLGVPCLTMRPNTERPITCHIGTNVLVGTDPQRILHEANSILDGHTRPGAIPEKWDGCAAERIVDVLLSQSARFAPSVG